MANPEQPAIQVRAVAGWTEKGSFVLVPGTKPVSIGTQGQWVIFAEGVAPVHLYFAFDGTTVYIAAASPAQTVLLAGRPIGAGWATAAVPSEIRFGAATLMLEPALGVSTPASSAPSSPNTVSDGGALWEAAQRAVQAAQVAAPVTAPGPAPATKPDPAHPLGPLASTIVMVPNPAAALLQDALMPPPGQGTAVAPSGPGFAAMPGMQPERRSVPPGQMQAPFGSMPPDAFGGLPGAMSPSHEPAQVPDWVRPPEQSSPATTEPEARPGFWKSTSGPKKATLLLMPFVLAASYYLLFMEPVRRPAAPKAKPGPAASITPLRPSSSSLAREQAAASGTASAAGELARLDAGNVIAQSAGADTANGGGAANPVVRAGRLASPIAKATGKTPERAALDDVSAGSFDDAAKEYDALSAQHPDDPVLRDAARILHQKASRSR
jgi:hypothetical protein